MSTSRSSCVSVAAAKQLSAAGRYSRPIPVRASVRTRKNATMLPLPRGESLPHDAPPERQCPFQPVETHRPASVSAMAALVHGAWAPPGHEHGAELLTPCSLGHQLGTAVDRTSEETLLPWAFAGGDIVPVGDRVDRPVHEVGICDGRAAELPPGTEASKR